MICPMVHCQENECDSLAEWVIDPKCKHEKADATFTCDRHVTLYLHQAEGCGVNLVSQLKQPNV